MPLAETVDLVALAAATEGMVGAEIEALSRQAGLCAIREMVSGRAGAEPEAALRLEPRHFEEALVTARRDTSGRAAG